MAKYQITNSSSTLNLYSSSEDYIPSFDPIKRRIKTADRFNEAGSFVYSDGKIDSRMVSFEFSHGNDSGSDTQMRDFLNTMVAFFDPVLAPFYLIDIDNLIRIKVACPQIDPKMPNTIYTLVQKGILDLMLLDGLWEDSTATTTSGTLTTGTSLMVTNSGKFNVYPIITITGKGSNPDFEIKSEELGGGFRIQDLTFSIGDVCIIDAVNGSITINGVSSPTSLTQGGMIYLRPSTNSLTYTSIHGNIDISVDHRGAYAY